MIALLASAFALTCPEVVHMDQAGVAPAEIVHALHRAHWAIDPAFTDCLRSAALDPAVLDAARTLGQPSAAWTQDLPTQSWPAKTASSLSVELACGVLRVQGAATDRVSVHGRTEARGALSASTEAPGLILRVEDLATRPEDPTALPRLSATGRRPAEPPCADLTLTVPRGLALTVRSTRADVLVRHVDGPLDLSSQFGDVDVVGDTPELVLRTIGGSLRADTGARFVEAHTVSGPVELGLGPEARAQIASISGPVWLWGGPVRRVTLDTVSGDVHLNLDALAGGQIAVVTHNGDIEAAIPAGGAFALSSREGRVSGPNRLIRPNGPSSRVGRPVGAPPPPRFDQLDQLGPATRTLWSQEQAERWWFPTGAVIRHTRTPSATDYTFEATSFSGDVAVRPADLLPAPTGPIVAHIALAEAQLQACAAAQLARHPAVSGHGVAHLRIRPDGSLAELSAPATAATPEAVQDGAFSACVVRALKDSRFPAGGEASIRWPVRFQPDPRPPR